MGRGEAERFCIVFDGNATTAVSGWQLSAAEKIRTKGLSGVADLSVGASDISVKEW